MSFSYLWVSDYELEAPKEASQFPEQEPPSPDYVPKPEHPPSPDYVPGFEHPPSPDYVPGPEYPKYLVPSDDEVPIEDQPLPVDALPTTLSPGYIDDSDPEEDPKEDHADYPADGGDEKDKEESYEDDADDEASKEEEDDDEEEEEHLSSADTSTIPIDDPVSSAEARISVRPQTLIEASAEALIAEYASAPTPPSPPPSPLTLLSSPLPQISSPPLPLPSPPTHTSPTYSEALLGYRATMIRSRATLPLPLPAPSLPLLLLATDRREDISEADVPPQKRLCLNFLAPMFKVGESSTAAAARQPGLDVTHATDYGFVDTMDATPGRLCLERAPTTLKELSQRVTDLATTLAWDTHEMYVHIEDAQDDRALLRA
ncbi:hypothetical protein Tco_0168932 [Tanacetum coccineum]